MVRQPLHFIALLLIFCLLGDPATVSAFAVETPLPPSGGGAACSLLLEQALIANLIASFTPAGRRAVSSPLRQAAGRLRALTETVTLKIPAIAAWEPLIRLAALVHLSPITPAVTLAALPEFIFRSTRESTERLLAKRINLLQDKADELARYQSLGSLDLGLRGGKFVVDVGVQSNRNRARHDRRMNQLNSLLDPIEKKLAWRRKDYGSFGPFLKAARRTAGLSIVELARSCMCEPGLIKQLEADQKKPSLRLAKLLGRRLNFDGPLALLHFDPDSAQARRQGPSPTSSDRATIRNLIQTAVVIPSAEEMSVTTGLSMPSVRTHTRAILEEILSAQGADEGGGKRGEALMRVDTAHPVDEPVEWTRQLNKTTQKIQPVKWKRARRLQSLSSRFDEVHGWITSAADRSPVSRSPKLLKAIATRLTLAGIPKYFIEIIQREVRSSKPDDFLWAEFSRRWPKVFMSLAVLLLLPSLLFASDVSVPLAGPAIGWAGIATTSAIPLLVDAGARRILLKRQLLQAA